MLWREFLGTIKTTFCDETEKTRGRYYCFFKGRPSSDSLFMAVRLNQESIAVRIRTDSNFRDEKKWTKNKIYHNWFFTKDLEREFNIANMNDADYAIKLIGQSYALAKTHIDDSQTKNRT